MSRLEDAEVFVAVVDAGGFTAAAIALGVTQPAVSRRIAALEARLGVRLLMRSTRRLRPTAAGSSFYARARRAWPSSRREREASAESAGCAAASASRRCWPCRHVVGRIAPSLRPSRDHVDLALTERRLDLAEERWTCAADRRPGPRPRLIHTCLTDFAVVACAAPSYLAAHGMPGRRPISRDCLLLQVGRRAATSGLHSRRPRQPGRPPRAVAVQVRGPMRSNTPKRSPPRPAPAWASRPSDFLVRDLRRGPACRPAAFRDPADRRLRRPASAAICRRVLARCSISWRRG
jgi:DNA-binding transcriptional LysR family regulator